MNLIKKEYKFPIFYDNVHVGLLVVICGFFNENIAEEFMNNNLKNGISKELISIADKKFNKFCKEELTDIKDSLKLVKDIFIYDKSEDEEYDVLITDKLEFIIQI